jgi:hypothetical protein
MFSPRAATAAACHAFALGLFQFAVSLLLTPHHVSPGRGPRVNPIVVIFGPSIDESMVGDLWFDGGRV